MTKRGNRAKPPKPWSKLQRAIYEVISPDAKFQIHCNSYRIGMGLPVPRYWVTVEGDIVWDFPHDHLQAGMPQVDEDGWMLWDGTHAISDLIREYVDTAPTDLFTKEFNDKYNLVPLLLAADKRVGKRRLQSMLDTNTNKGVERILMLRLHLEAQSDVNNGATNTNE